MSCNRAISDGFNGSCFDCPFTLDYCDKANGGDKEYKEKIKANKKRNMEIRMLKQNGCSIRELRKSTGLSRSHLINISKGVY